MYIIIYMVTIKVNIGSMKHSKTRILQIQHLMVKLSSMPKQRCHKSEHDDDILSYFRQQVAFQSQDII